jgi:hypothetical protein
MDQGIKNIYYDTRKQSSAMENKSKKLYIKAGRMAKENEFASAFPSHKKPHPNVLVIKVMANRFMQQSG